MITGFWISPPATISSRTGSARVGERVEDHARAERGRLDQRAVDVLGAGGERQADDQAAELVVDEHRAVAVVPVEREQPVRADLLRAASSDR